MTAEDPIEPWILIIVHDSVGRWTWYDVDVDVDVDVVG